MAERHVKTTIFLKDLGKKSKVFRDPPNQIMGYTILIIRILQHYSQWCDEKFTRQAAHEREHVDQDSVEPWKSQSQ